MQVDAFLFATEVYDAGGGRKSIREIIWDLRLDGPCPGLLDFYFAATFEPGEADTPITLEVHVFNPDAKGFCVFGMSYLKPLVDPFDGHAYMVESGPVVIPVTTEGVYLFDVFVNDEMVRENRIAFRFDPSDPA